MRGVSSLRILIVEQPPGAASHRKLQLVFAVHGVCIQ